MIQQGRGRLGYPCGPGAPLLAREGVWERDGTEDEAEGTGHPCQDQCITPHLLQGYRGGGRGIVGRARRVRSIQGVGTNLREAAFPPGRRYVHGHLLR